MHDAIITGIQVLCIPGGVVYNRYAVNQVIRRMDARTKASDVKMQQRYLQQSSI